MGTFGKAVVDFYFSIWWQLFVGSSLAGFISTLGAAIWMRQVRQLGRYGSFFRIVLYLAAVHALVPIGLSVVHHHDSPWVIVCYFQMRLLFWFAVGVLLAASIASLPSFANKSKSGLLGILMEPQTIRAARFSVASLYISTGATKLLAHETIDFFHASGYSTAFFLFIAIWELVSGLGLAFQRTSFFALIALSIDMFGAIYTHFHNYLTRGFPGPLGNSLDALRMLFLMTYIGFGLKRLARRDELPCPVAAQAPFTD